VSSFPYIDVDAKAELPQAPAGHRYLDFIGGDRELRCFLVPRAMPRADFLRDRIDQVDEALRPVYERRDVVVRQDCSYALPGFYVVSYATRYAAFDLAPMSRHLELSAVLYEVRRAMRSDLGIEHIHLHYEEKDEPSCSVHYWLLPIESRRGRKETLLTHLDLHEYLRRFRFRETRERILDCNARLRAALLRSGVEALQDAASSGLLPGAAVEG
jgi:hypothetical protein